MSLKKKCVCLWKKVHEINKPNDLAYCPAVDVTHNYNGLNLAGRDSSERQVEGGITFLCLVNNDGAIRAKHILLSK